MKWLIASPLNTLPPLGLLAVGAVVGAAGLPIVRKTARGLAVLTVRGVLAVQDVVKETGVTAKNNWESMVQRARDSELNLHQTSTYANNHGTKLKDLEVQNENVKTEKHGANISSVNDTTEKSKT